MRILASLLSLPVKVKHVDGFVVRELKVNSQNCQKEGENTLSFLVKRQFTSKF